MIPELVFGGLIFKSYHLINLLAIIVFSIYLLALVKTLFVTILDAMFYICSLLVFGLIGSKILFSIEAHFNGTVNDFFNLTSGFVLYGGLFSMLFLTIYFEKLNGINRFDLLDNLVKAFCVLIGIGKFACIAAGCCYGFPTNNKLLGIVFTNPKCIAFPQNEPLFAIQFMDAIASFIILIIIVLFPKKTKGYSYLIFALLYPFYRFFSEILRADDYRGSFFYSNLSLSQFYSILFLLSSFILIYSKQNLKVLRSNP